MSTEEAHDDHGHHLPAVQDWPRGFSEASWWPFATAVGGAGIYVGAGLYVTGQDRIVGQTAGPVMFVGSIFLFLAGLYGWLYHAFVSHFWPRDASQKSASKLRWGMITFLGSELGTFGALFVYYFFTRAGTWSPQELPYLTGSLVLANTTILIVPSLTFHWAHVATHEESHRSFILGLAVTLLFGVIFIGGQVYEYYEFIVHPNFSITDDIFGSAFYGLTGLCGLHVSLGTVLLGIIFVRALRGQYSTKHHVSVSTASMYWHSVDVVWIFLVVVLYIGAEVGA